MIKTKEKKRKSMATRCRDDTQRGSTLLVEMTNSSDSGRVSSSGDTTSSVLDNLTGTLDNSEPFDSSSERDLVLRLLEVLLPKFLFLPSPLS